MQIKRTPFSDVLLVEPQVFNDQRGSFLETYQIKKFEAAGISHAFVQDNLAVSCKGVLRGLHYQIHNAQGKLVQVVYGEIFDAIVDIRRGSANFGKWFGVHLKAEDNNQLWIPLGYAHGYYVLSDDSKVIYKVTDFYTPAAERTLLWNDPDVGIKWPLSDSNMPILSEKDAKGKLLRDADVYD